MANSNAKSTTKGSQLTSAKIYQFALKTLAGKDILLSDFQGKILLIVNTASYCGFTPQYEGLQSLYQKYQDKGLIIIGCPCNQFGKQEPDDKEVISQNCKINFGVTFLISEKILVNGKDAHPLFIYLKDSLPGLFWTKNIKWNFTKFLIDRSGQPIKRYAPFTTPAKIEHDIQKLL